jgi:hypothetical protein
MVVVVVCYHHHDLDHVLVVIDRKEDHLLPELYVQAL